MADTTNTALLDIANNGAALNQALSELTTNVAKLSSITLPVGNGGTGLTAPGANGNVLTSNGTGWISSAIPAFSGVLTVPNGGTGLFSLTAYGVLCGGTTTTGNVQSVASVGTSGQVLTSNGASSLPTFQTIQGPAFSAYQSSAQSALSAGVYTKLLFQTKEFDTDNYFSTSTSRFTPLVAGYYQIDAGFQINGSSTSVGIVIYKNGSAYKNGSFCVGSVSSPFCCASALVLLNGSTDYVEIYGATGTSLQPFTGLSRTFFQGCLLRKA